jgi:hypothetical protein
MPTVRKTREYKHGRQQTGANDVGREQQTICDPQSDQSVSPPGGKHEAIAV